jgi:CHAD domain-containing protein
LKRWAKLAGNTEVGTASQFVVAGQLAKLKQYVEKLQSSDSDDIDAVHQLRVYCRRIHATIDVLADFIPKEHVKLLLKRTKRLRKAAGEVRDWDVLAIDLNSLKPEASDQEHLAIEHLQTKYAKKRAKTRKRLADRLKKLEEKKFWPWVADHYHIQDSNDDDSADSNEGTSFHEVARWKLRDELERFQSIFTEQEFGSPRDLHLLRIATKRFRYALDVFANCFSKEAFKEVYAPVKELQDALGIINDAAQFAERFADRRVKSSDKELRGSLALLEERYLSEQSARIQAFREAWPLEAREKYAHRFRHTLHLEPDHPSHLAAKASPE